MSQLNVDNIVNRLGTAGPTTPSLQVTNSVNAAGVNVTGIVTANSVNTSNITTQTGLNVSGVSTATRFVSTQATGTSPLTVSSTTLVSNLNADLLDNQQGSFYQDAGNLNAGTIPSARLATGTASIDTFLRGDRTWANITSYSDYGSLEQVSGTTRKNISAIHSITPRYNTYNAWSSSGPWTTLYAYGAAGQSDAEQWSWFGLGFVPGQTSSASYSDTLANYPLTRQHMNVTGNNIGSQSTNIMYANSTSYNPVSILMMPIRNNHPSSSISVTVYGMHSSYWSSGYDGSSLWYYTPNTNGSYSAVSSGTWSNAGSRTGNNTYNLTWSSTVTIPAQTTYVFMQVATSLYWTSSSSSYWMLDQNKFYSLDSTFSSPWIQVDNRMINTMKYADWQRYGLTSNTYQFFKVYNACADMYGNR